MPDNQQEHTPYHGLIPCAISSVPLLSTWTELDKTSNTIAGFADFFSSMSYSCRAYNLNIQENIKKSFTHTVIFLSGKDVRRFSQLSLQGLPGTGRTQ